MHRNKKKRNIIIFSLVGVLLCMVAGYAAFQTRLEIKGTSKVTSNWNILITNVTAGTPTGSAENAVAPKWDKLTASMEANLYDKGDAMEYDVTIENQGTIDAKLNDILTNLQNSNSEAVLITFSGYAKGEILKAKSTKIIHVKIEYNSEYKGGETSSEVTIDFDYGQNNNEENNPDDQYLLTYDYSTNGGQSVELDKEYVLSGSNVNLDNTATKEGWTFVGWNTDKDAQIGLKEYQMPKENTTLYAIYSKDLKVTYEKEDTVESIGKNEDACTIYNNETSCEVTLPEINVNDESATIGWYENNNKVGNPGDKYTLKNNITLKAKAEFEPIIQSWSNGASTDFHAKEYRENIITATFLDNKDVPDNAVASWDVSANKNRSVMAWIVADESDSTKYHLYIGGDGGVIANKTSSYLFYNFTALTKINFGDNFDTSNITNMRYMFYNCSSLTNLDVSNFDTSNVTTMELMFSNCSSLTTIDVSKWDTSKVTTMWNMFYDCSSLTSLDVSKWDTSSVTSMYQMFTRCSSLTTLDVSNFDTSNVTDMSSMFYGCSSLTTLDVSKWDTSKVTNMRYMFYNCSSLTTLDVSNFKTSNVTDMSRMFYDCSSLITLDVSNWNTSNVTNMAGMFSGCNQLTELDVSKWDTGNVKTMGEYTTGATIVYPGGMFQNCSSLTNLDLSGWDTSNVTNMGQMFNGCSNLTTLDISGWDTNNLTVTKYMFGNCSSLTKLALCSFNTTNVTNMEYMFDNTSNLKSIYVGPNWTTENATTTGMFTNSGVSAVTQSNNCEIDSEDMSLSISTTSTTNSIRVVANATADSGIAKYEYSKDGGKTWVNGGTNNTYTFTELKNGTSYNIAVRVTSNIEKQTEQSATVLTKNITTPTFKESETSNGKTVTITYPSGCGSSLTCTYQKDNGSVVNVTSATVNVSFTASGSLVATVSDGTNTVSSSYTVTIIPYGEASDTITELVSTNTDELYTDDNDNIRYYGAEPNNYVYYNCTNVNNQTSSTCELWRIMGIIDGKVKIIKDEVLTPVTTDNGVTIGTSSGFYWNKVQQSGKNYNNWEDSTLQTYLNGTYYNSLNSTYRNMISEETYYLGGATISNYRTLTASGYYNAERDSSQVYSGNPGSTTQNIGLMYPSDYGYAAGESCLSTALRSYSSSCKNTDYLFIGKIEWLQAHSISYSGDAAILNSFGYVHVNANYVYARSYAVRPVLYLNSNVQITDGIGSQSNPFKLK